MSYLHCIGVIFAVLVVTLASAPCCVPQKYEGLVSFQEVTFGGALGGIHFLEAEYNISIDYVGKKVAVSFLYYGLDGTSLPTFFILMDYQNRIEYIVQDRMCAQNKLPTPMPSNCLPDVATQVVKDHFGAANEMLPINRYVYKLPTLNFTETVSVTENYCYPVLSTQTVGGSDTRALVSGLSIGIKNPGIFNVPDVCKHHLTHSKILPKDLRSGLFTWIF